MLNDDHVCVRVVFSDLSLHEFSCSLSRDPTYFMANVNKLADWPLWKGFSTILHFQEILVLMLNL